MQPHYIFRLHPPQPTTDERHIICPIETRNQTPALLAFGLKSSTRATGCNRTPLNSSLILPLERMLGPLPLDSLTAEFRRSRCRATNSRTHSPPDWNNSRHPIHHSLFVSQVTNESITFLNIRVKSTMSPVKI